MLTLEWNQTLTSPPIAASSPDNGFVQPAVRADHEQQNPRSSQRFVRPTIELNNTNESD